MDSWAMVLFALRFPEVSLVRHARTCCGHPRLSVLQSKAWMAGT
jgi:hypothetical protein